MAKELLFSVTKDDCVFDCMARGGPGGQHQNKTASAVRCTHKDSGAVGMAKDERSQHQNKKLAFRRMAESKKFRDWIKLESAKKTGELAEIEARVERDMRPGKIRAEVKNEKGLWVEMVEG
jgi:protein subunit release factor B